MWYINLHIIILQVYFLLIQGGIFMGVAQVHEIDRDDSLLDELSVLARKNNYIPPELHTKYNTKRGLRNSDGTGVLVGLTNIGDVIGYTKDEKGAPIPTEG